MIFVDEAFAGALPARCGTVQLSPLLVELIGRAMDYGNDYPPAGPAARLAQMMLDELARMQMAPYLLPVSRDPRLARAMDMLVAAPTAGMGIEHVADHAGVTARTLARLFRQDTGMTFTQWRTRLLLVEAIDRLARGATVGRVAYELGYGTISSFVYMFRRNVGVAPGAYRSGQEALSVEA